MEQILNDPAKITFLLFCSVIVTDVIFAAVIFARTKDFVANARTVNISIAKLEPAHKCEVAYLNFSDPLGKQIVSSVKVPRGAFKVGDEIEILSHKNHPERIKLNSKFSLWAIPAIMVFSAIPLVVALLGMLQSGMAKLPF